MTTQAENSISLYRGGKPSTIVQLLRMQKASVVDELKAHYGVDNIHALAVQLSLP